MNDVNAEQTLARKTPTVKMVVAWIEQANTLPEKISHQVRRFAGPGQCRCGTAHQFIGEN